MADAGTAESLPETGEAASRVDVSGSISQVNDHFYQQGWTDGLPVVPPTPDRVSAMLDYVGLDRRRVLGEVPVRRRTLTAEQAAANVVMAGCLPEYYKEKQKQDP